MRPANMDALKEKVVRPDFDKHLIPLLLYRGQANLGWAARGFNLAVAMMESECLSVSEGFKIQQNPDYSQLAGPRSPLQHTSMHGLFVRLRENPKVTDNVAGLTKYCRDFHSMHFRLQPVSMETMRRDAGRRGEYIRNLRRLYENLIRLRVSVFPAYFTRMSFITRQSVVMTMN